MTSIFPVSSLVAFSITERSILASSSTLETRSSLFTTSSPPVSPCWISLCATSPPEIAVRMPKKFTLGTRLSVSAPSLLM